MVLNAFKSGIFSLQLTEGTGNLGMLARVLHASDCNVVDPASLKILNSKQMLQILPIPLAQVQAGNTSENLLNEIRQIKHSLYQVKDF